MIHAGDDVDVFQALLGQVRRTPSRLKVVCTPTFLRPATTYARRHSGTWTALSVAESTWRAGGGVAHPAIVASAAKTISPFCTSCSYQVRRVTNGEGGGVSNRARSSNRPISDRVLTCS